MCSGHLRHFSGSSLPIILCSVWCTLSADPLVCGWYGMVLIFSIPSSLHIAAITSPVNSVPWSDISFWGNPKTEKKLLYRTWAVVWAVWLFVTKAWTYLVKWSTITSTFFTTRLFLSSHSNLHPYIIYVYQFHGLGA